MNFNKNYKSNWPFADTIKTAEKQGNNLELCDIEKVCIDKQNNIVSSPA